MRIIKVYSYYTQEEVKNFYTTAILNSENLDVNVIQTIAKRIEEQLLKLAGEFSNFTLDLVILDFSHRYNENILLLINSDYFNGSDFGEEITIE